MCRVFLVENKFEVYDVRCINIIFIVLMSFINWGSCVVFVKII